MTPKNDPNYRQSAEEELRGEYEIECTNCRIRRAVTEYTSCGWKVGDVMGTDPANPSYGKCFRCKKYGLKIVKTPILQPGPLPTGFAATLKE